MTYIRFPVLVQTSLRWTPTKRKGSERHDGVMRAPKRIAEAAMLALAVMAETRSKERSIEAVQEEIWPPRQFRANMNVDPDAQLRPSRTSTRPPLLE